MSKLNENPHISEDTPLYYRIGTAYFRNIRIPMADGTEVERLVPWSAEAIKLDHNKEAFSNPQIVKKLDSFVFIPSISIIKELLKTAITTNMRPCHFCQ